MNFVYVLPDKDAGVASVVRNLLHYKQTNIKTKVILLHNIREDSFSRIKDNFNADEIIRIEYDANWGSKWKLFKKIKRHFTSNSILISNDGGVDLDFIRLMKYNIPVIYIMHGDYRHYYNVIKSKYTSIDLIICVSDFLKQQVLDTLRSIENTATVVQSLKFPVPDSISTSKGSNSQIKIVYVGSLVINKGVYLFKRIIKELESLEVNYLFKIIGNGPERDKLENDFRQNSNVHFLGSIQNDKVLKEHENNDVILLCSDNEGLPVCVVEGMKSGVIPIVNDIKSGIPELVKNGKTGFIIKGNNPSQYAAKILALYTDRLLLGQMKLNCIEFANRKFNPVKQTLAYEMEFINCAGKFKNRKQIEISLIERILIRLPNKISFKLTKILKY